MKHVCIALAFVVANMAATTAFATTCNSAGKSAIFALLGHDEGSSSCSSGSQKDSKGQSEKKDEKETSPLLRKSDLDLLGRDGEKSSEFKKIVFGSGAPDFKSALSTKKGSDEKSGEGRLGSDERRAGSGSGLFGRSGDGKVPCLTDPDPRGPRVGTPIPPSDVVEAPVPLPVAFPLMATALGGLGLVSRRRKRATVEG